jgi:predicted DNA-binding transcriptional regulator AlpA
LARYFELLYRRSSGNLQPGIDRKWGVQMAESLKGLEPDQLVRWIDGPKYFGLRKSQLDENIRKGLIPRPFPIVEGGRAKAWTGRQILEHQQQRQAAPPVQKRVLKRKQSATAE